MSDILPDDFRSEMQRAAAALMAAITLAIAGCTTATPAQVPLPSSEELVPTQTAKVNHAEKTCAMLSVIESTSMNAMVGLANGRISTVAFAAVVNTIPDSLATIKALEAAYADNLARLSESVDVTPAAVDGALFNPDGSPYRNEFQALRVLCESNGTPIVTIPNSPGG